MIEVLTFDRLLTQLRYFFVYLLLLHEEILGCNFQVFVLQLNSEIPFSIEYLDEI